MTIHEDAVTNPSNGPHLNDLVDARIEDAGRRGLLRGGLGLSALGFIGGGTGLLAGCGSDDSTPATAVATFDPPPRPPHRRQRPVPSSLVARVCRALGRLSRPARTGRQWGAMLRGWLAGGPSGGRACARTT